MLLSIYITLGRMLFGARKLNQDESIYPSTNHKIRQHENRQVSIDNGTPRGLISNRRSARLGSKTS